jgi:hypothetical protein
MDSSILAVRETNSKPGVLVQTQTTGIQFDNGVRYAEGICEKCGHPNHGIYFRGQEEYLSKHGCYVTCCNCGIPVKVKVG